MIVVIWACAALGIVVGAVIVLAIVLGTIFGTIEWILAGLFK